MTSYDQQSLEAAIVSDTARGLVFEIHEGDLAYTLGLTLAETTLDGIESAMQTMLGDNDITVEYVARRNAYVFSRPHED